LRPFGTRIAVLWLGCLLWQAAIPALAAVSFVPLSDLHSGTYLGFPGGLYENGSNDPPADHAAAGLAAAARIRPLDRTGAPAANGRIVFVSIGMSNTTQEFCSTNNPAPCDSWSFVGQALADPAVNHGTLVLVNGAAGGQAGNTWDSPTRSNYDRVRDSDLAPLGLSEAQVQVAWVKVADAQPTRSLPAASADAYVLETEMGNIARALKVRYPNIQIAYFSSRIYAGYATSNLNPEPYAYESGFAVKWLVQAQIDQRRSGTIADPKAGNLTAPTSAPWIAWGPYLWANGAAPRSDGLTWLPSELASDGTHPATPARQKVGRMLLDFLKTAPTARGWFLNAPETRRRAAGHS
jgi:hypothetical protein